MAHNSIEILYHFTCPECKLWWSIAMGGFSTDLDHLYADLGVNSREFFCPWCGKKSEYNVENPEDGGEYPMGGGISSEED